MAPHYKQVIEYYQCSHYCQGVPEYVPCKGLGMFLSCREVNDICIASQQCQHKEHLEQYYAIESVNGSECGYNRVAFIRKTSFYRIYSGQKITYYIE
ncbi:MAG: hypothetical protein A4E23_00705 [Methanomethylovorans sp. PtaU1.Bin073]|nr:MAG: hypothetical protein A4E23_00705 [Methanomethylovorans sp. PtaU1.Bin073]